MGISCETKVPSTCKIGKCCRQVCIFCVRFRVPSYPRLKSKHAERPSHQTTMHHKNAHRPAGLCNVNPKGKGL